MPTNRKDPNLEALQVLLQPIINEIGRIYGQARDDSQLTQVEIADKLRIDVTTISRIENGKWGLCVVGSLHML